MVIKVISIVIVCLLFCAAILSAVDITLYTPEKITPDTCSELEIQEGYMVQNDKIKNNTQIKNILPPNVNDVIITTWADKNTQPTQYNAIEKSTGQSKFQIEYTTNPSINIGFHSPLIPTSNQTIYILVDSGIYNSIITSINQYVDDLETTGYQVTVYNGSWASVGDVRTLLQGGVLSNGLIGAVLIGDIIAAWYEMDIWGHEEFPIDYYYMDLDGTWTDSDNDGIFDGHTGNVAPEIWVGRLKSSILGNEIANLQNYFNKNHNYKTGSLSLPNLSLAYIDDDWIPWANSWNNSVGLVYSNGTLVQDGGTTIDSDYESRLTQNYEWIHLAAHSAATYHHFKIGSEWTGGTTTSSEIASIDPHALFYNLFCCSGTRYIESNNIGTQYIFANTYGICAVGSTKTGSMLNLNEFYSPLSNNECIGEAFKNWFTAWGETSPAWFYGMNILGDPLLTTTYDVTVFSPNVSSFTHPNQDIWYTNNDTSFSWTTPADLSGIAGYYFIIDLNNDTTPTELTGTWTTNNSINFTDLPDGIWHFHIVSKDNSSNIASIATHYRIKIDTTPPTGSVLINSGNLYTTSTSVTLALTGNDVNGVTEMRFSNNGTKWGDWEPYASSKGYTLHTGDGVKTVYVQYKDDAGLISTSLISTSIILDTTMPTGSISINSGDEYSTSTTVTLSLTGNDANSVTEMRFSDNGTKWGNWEPFATSSSYTLPNGDGVKTVYVQFKDNAGLISTSTISTSVILDTIIPIGSISINSGDEYTTSTTVNLTLMGNDVNGVFEIKISNDPDFKDAKWETFFTFKEWIINLGDGDKPVYIKFKDKANLISEVYLDSIILDETLPTGSILINNDENYTTLKNVNLEICGMDLNGISKMMVSNESSFKDTDWEPYNTTKSWVLEINDGLQWIYIKFMDNAGLISITYSDEIILDTIPPSGSILIENGKMYTNSLSVVLDIDATDDTSGLWQMSFSNNGTDWTTWETFHNSKSWFLIDGDGLKIIYIKIKDRAGLICEINNTIILDTKPPIINYFIINNGEQYANSTNVTLLISAHDEISEIIQICYSNDGLIWSSWVTFTPLITWELFNGDGNKTVWIKIMDKAGNVANRTSEIIILDTTPPQIISNIPSNGDMDVPFDSIIIITFNERINISTITLKNITVTDEYGNLVPGIILYDNLTATFKPGNNLGFNNTYVVMIKTSIKDLAGNRLTEVHSWSFTTIKKEEKDKDTDKDDIPDSEDNDDDNDNIPDDWEEKYGFDSKDPSDALLDVDNDKLTNLEEFLIGTNPNNSDSDDDGFDDKIESDKNTDPNDPTSFPEKLKPSTEGILGMGRIFDFFILMIIIIIISLVIGLIITKRRKTGMVVEPLEEKKYEMKETKKKARREIERRDRFYINKKNVKKKGSLDKKRNRNEEAELELEVEWDEDEDLEDRGPEVYYNELEQDEEVEWDEDEDLEDWDPEVYDKKLEQDEEVEWEDEDIGD